MNMKAVGLAIIVLIVLYFVYQKFPTGSVYWVGGTQGSQQITPCTVTSAGWSCSLSGWNSMGRGSTTYQLCWAFNGEPTSVTYGLPANWNDASKYKYSMMLTSDHGTYNGVGTASSELCGDFSVSCPFQTCSHVYGQSSYGSEYEWNLFGNVQGVFTAENVMLPPSNPNPEPPKFSGLLALIIEWLTSVWKWLSGASIIGGGMYVPSSSATFQITLSSPIDSDCSDGSCTIQYGGWAVINKAGSIVQEGEWEKTTGSWSKSVAITTPSAVGDYAFVAVLYNYNMKYVSSWVTDSESIAAKEAVEFKVSYGTPSTPTPPSWFDNIINTIRSFLKGLFPWLPW